MHILITGADGFVGTALVQRLLTEPPPALAARPLRLSLLDRQFRAPPTAPQVEQHAGDLGDPALLQRVLATPVDLVFHLASLPGAQAERDPELGLAANLLAPVALLNALAQQRRQSATAPVPRVVLASSVAVYGPTDPSRRLHEDARPQPALSYGTHKWMTELLLADHSRRGELDGRSLRLPGIVARPSRESGHGSAFMSQIFHALREGQVYRCPTSPQATAWWMSLGCCLDNLLHAATLPADDLPASRCWQVPVLTASVDQVVQAIEQALGAEAPPHLAYHPDAEIEARFGRYPAIDTPAAEAAGFRHDGSIAGLVARVLSQLDAADGAAR